MEITGHSKQVIFVEFLLFFYSNITFLECKCQVESLPAVHVKVEESNICTSPGKIANVTCTVTKSLNSSSVEIKSWHVSWRYDDKVFPSFVRYRNNSVIVCVLAVYVDWSDERVFNCVATGPDNGSNTPFNISKAIVITSLVPLEEPAVLGVRFVQEEYSNLLQVLWEDTYAANVSYILQYCINGPLDFYEMEQSICPTYDSWYSTCFKSKRDIYGISYSTRGDQLCMVAFEGLYFTNYTFRVVSEQHGCQNTGSPRSVYTKPFEEFLGNASKTGSADRFVAVLIPSTVHFHHIVAKEPRTVNLKWDSPERRRFKLRYNCSRSQLHQTVTTTSDHVVLSSRHFLPYNPYDVCEFCISSRIYIGGKYSEPNCNVTRLPEEAPSAGPIIRCSDDRCPFTVKGNYKDVRLSWTLPARGTWNGILTHLKIQATHNDTEHLVITVQNVTQDYVIITLRKDWVYTLSMVACTRMGCGGIGNTITMLQSGQQLRSSTRVSSNMITAVWILGFVIVVLALGLAYCIYHQRRSRTVSLTSAQWQHPEHSNVRLVRYRETEL